MCDLAEQLIATVDNRKSYADTYFKISKLSDKYRFEIGAMYESPITINFAKLKEFSDLFGTVKIDVDDYANSGCETCDYGSSYGHIIDVYEPTKNVAELEELVGQDLFNPKAK